MMRWQLKSKGKGVGLVMLLLLIGLVAPAAAQETGAVVVQSNLGEAVLFADSTRLGPVGARTYRLAAGSVRLRALPPEVLNWSVMPLDTTVTVPAGDTLRLVLDFPHYYRVETVPFGVPVYLVDGGDRHMLGTTPLLYVDQEPVKGTLVVDEPGYHIEQVDPGGGVWNVYRLTLQPTVPEMASSEQIAWRPPQKRRWWIDAAALGIAATATAVSVHYKFKADRLEEEREKACRADDFGPQCSPAVADQIHDYDRIAAWSLGAAQVGVGVFAIRLVLR